MRRLPLLTTLAAVAAVAMPASAGAVTYGISDQQASTFSNPLYKPLKLKEARYVAPWDTVFDATQRGRLDAWYAAASAAGQRLLVSFEHSRTPGAENSVPTVEQYEAATKLFHERYPLFKDINTWNEVNACQKAGQTERQPLGICKPSKAKLLVQYWASNKRVFKGAKIIPLDVLDDKNPGAAIKYIKAFKKVMPSTPKIWGVHNYSDTNRRSSSRTKKILDAIGPKGEVWLLETGGQLNVQPGSFSQKEKGAARALNCMFSIAKKYPRIKKVFIYQFNGSAPGAKFDAGLINTDNTPRPGWTVVKKRQAKACS